MNSEDLVNTFRSFLCLAYFGIQIIDSGEMERKKEDGYFNGRMPCFCYKFSVPEFSEIEELDSEVAKVVGHMSHKTSEDLIQIAAHIIREGMVLSSLINDEELANITTEEKREIVNRDVRLFAKVRKDEKWSEYDGVQTVLEIIRGYGRLAGIR